MKLLEITSENLKDMDSKELLMLHFRMHQLYGSGNANTEDVVNAHSFIVAEMKKRGMNHNIVSPLDTVLAKTLGDSKDIMVVKDFVSIVGSSVSSENPTDIDILIRAKLTPDGFIIEKDNILLPVRNFFGKERALHVIDGPQGSHGDYIPVFDLVMRAKKPETIVVKSGDIRIDLGCGENKPEGYIGIDVQGYPWVDIIHDLNKGIPLPDNCADEIRAYHVLEHLENDEFIMKEIWRVLKPGGRFIFEVPSTNSEGAFAPGHRSFWNITKFKFWTDSNLLDGRPQFLPLYITEVERNGYKYIVGCLLKPYVEKKELRPIMTFPMQKPEMKFYVSTEAFSPEEIWRWVEAHLENGVVAEPKYNGFRSCIQKSGDTIEIYFEDAKKKRHIKEFEEELAKIPDDFIIDANVGIRKGNRMEARIDLMKLLAEKIELDKDERPVAILFDLLYWNEDIHEKPFEERRKLLEEFYSKYLKDSIYFELSPQVKIDSFEALEDAWREYGFRDNSEGLVLKDLKYPFLLSNATDGMAKIKHALEIKVIVLEVQENKNDTYSYRCGLLQGNSDIEADYELDGKKYVDLGKTFNTVIQANVGDIITCQVQEIIVGENSIDWLGATPLDVDRTRTEPYYVNQVIDLAERAGVLQERTEKARSKPLITVGGKWYIVRKLLPYIPEHKVYVEPFAGGASVFFKKASSEKEILNDVNPLIVASYRFLKNATDDDLERFASRDWIASREKFERLLQTQPKSTEDKAYKAMYVSAFSVIGVEATTPGAYMAEDGEDAGYTVEVLKKFRKRLRKTKITRMDGIECIKKFDSPDTFFFIDPPYLTTSSGRIYNHDVDREYLQKLVDELKNIKGKFMLTLYYKDLNYLDIPAKWNVRKYKARFFVGYASHTELSGRYEAMVTNYSIVNKISERSEFATRFWKNNWWKCFPSSGKGRFVYHHHWRGLTEEEIRLSDKELLNTNHSIHGDLRLEFDSGLWGLSIFLGKAIENRENEKFISGEKLRCAFKPIQPKEWLDVGVEEPYVSEPGDVGSTSKKYSKFFAIDTGKYEIGVWREHFFEIFLHGDRINGRYIVSYAPVGDERIWLVEKPEDQTPYADKYDKEEVIKELKEKGQKYLIWGKPGMKPELIILDDSVNKTLYGDFYSIEDEKHYVWAPFLIPNVVDTQSDFVRPEEIVKAVHRFTQTDMPVYYLHDVALPKEQARIVECAVVHGDLIVNGKRFPPYTAVCAIAIDDDFLWKEIVTGKITGVSIHAVVNKVAHGEYNELKNIRILHIGLADRPAVKQAVFQVMKTEVSKMSAVTDIKSIIDDLRELYDSLEDEDAKYKAPVATCIAILEGALSGVQYGYPYPEEDKEKTTEKTEEQEAQVKEENDDIQRAVSIVEEIRRLLTGGKHNG